jgi:HSP20 family protein
MEPFTRLVQEFDRLLDPSEPSEVHPPLNVVQTESEVKVSLEIPGMDVKDLEVEVHEGVLIITGKRETESVDEHAKWLLKERRTGNFERRVRLLWDVDTENLSASYRRGVLEIALPRTSGRRSRTIEITS